ncbi:hypothetical protein PG999_005366 [Apiospora kogelbergensis]|uniref:Uncharacterized protein n=1 Tax=Apiospora kogelbergensis TaxID=1337665 RepID=A0AAW0R1Z7_9PEZI
MAPVFEPPTRLHDEAKRLVPRRGGGIRWREALAERYDVFVVFIVAVAVAVLREGGGPGDELRGPGDVVLRQAAGDGQVADGGAVVGARGRRAAVDQGVVALAEEEAQGFARGAGGGAQADLEEVGFDGRDDGVVAAAVPAGVGEAEGFWDGHGGWLGIQMTDSFIDLDGDEFSKLEEETEGNEIKFSERMKAVLAIQFDQTREGARPASL